MDYQGNSNKKKKKTNPDQPKVEKKIQRVTTGEVVLQKKTLGQRAKALFIAADFGNVARYIFFEVMIPSAKNLIYDASTKGMARMVYGESQVRRQGFGLFGQGPRVTYNQPVSRPYNNPLSREPQTNIVTTRGPSVVRSVSETFILSSKEEAERVISALKDVIDQFDVVSVGDLYELIGAPSSHTDQKWGWSFLGDVPIHQVRDGYVIELPPTEAILQQ